MSTEFFNDQWRIPSNENQNKISNYSMEFDGSGSDVIDIGSQAFNPDHSISFWINSVVSGPNSYGGILAGGANSISIDQGGGVIGVGKIYFRISSVNYTVSSTIVSETWNHVVFTRNGTNVKCYINGVLDKTTTVPVYSTWQYIGAQLASGNNPFNGKLDQLTIFNYELSQDQVTQLGAAEGYAFNFNGTNDSIQIPTNSNLEITGNMTISAWIKSSSSSTGSTKIINKRNASSTNFDFFLDTGGTKLKFFDGTDNIASDISITLGVWNHVAITIQSGVTNGSIFYVNGVAQATNLPTFTIASNTAPLVVGASFGRNSAFFNGEISNVSIFNSSLSASNIITLYNNGSPAADISSLSPVGWWKLNAQDTFDGTNWTIKDYAGSSDGASLNMNASSLVLTNINGELVANPMAISPKPIAYYQLGDQSVSTGPTADYLVPNNSLQDYVFDFSSDKVTIPSYALTQNATVSFWVNFDSIPDDVVLGGVYGDRYPLIKSYLGNFQILISAPGQNTFFTTNTALVINTWYHIAISQNSSSATLYINGEVPSSGGTGNPATPTLTIIGGFSSGNPNLDGQLSNVSIFNSTLPATGTESIASLYNNGSPPADISSYSGLQRWYKLNAEDVFAYPNWIIIDSAGSNNGASVGMTSANLVQSNLQLGVGYSPYALELDGASNYFSCGSELGNSLGNAVTNFTLSGWYTAQGGASNEGLFGLSDASGNNKFSLVQSNYARRIVFFNNGAIQRSFDYDSRNQWANFVIVVSGNGSSPLTIKYYHDGTELSISSSSGTLPNSIDFSGNNAYIGNAYPLTNFFNGDVSNFSFFNFSLTSAQVTELNNNQRTANLNNLSFAKPLAWWELGSNSSFNSTTNTWTALNQGTSTGGNAISTANMTNDDIINGVGYTANGLGNSSIDIVGDAPYSTANALSVNMDVLDRVEDTPS